MAASNPYVGPRAFDEDDDLHGRDREIAELRDRLIADRIVLLYAPSGAGKSSLVAAGLVPALRELGFVIAPSIRLTHAHAQSSSDLPGFRYERSVLSSLSESTGGVPTDCRADLGEAISSDPRATVAIGSADEALADRLAALDAAGGRRVCLVFDQFEELFTLDPGDRVGKDAFMARLGEVLDDRQRWALFVIREDFVAQLDPYLELIPTALSSRMRLELLSPECAAAAVTAPASAGGRPFTDEAVVRLLNDLRRIHTESADDQDVVLGPFVEPVQLQVVCRRIWDSLPEEQTSIGIGNVSESGGVDGALRDYYATSVAEAANATGGNEARLRAWISDELIGPTGFRTQTMAGPGRSGTAVLRELEAAHLVRAESRHGQRWFELAHDRLVGPIAADNDSWRTAHVDDLVVRAELWSRLRSPGLLLGGRRLGEALAWQAGQGEDLLQRDREYLHACRQHQRRRTTNRLVGAMVVALVFAMVALAEANARTSQRAARIAAHYNAITLANLATQTSDTNGRLGLVLAAEAVGLTTPPVPGATAALITARLGVSRPWSAAGPVGDRAVTGVTSVAISLDGHYLATAGATGSIDRLDLRAAMPQEAVRAGAKTASPPSDGQTASTGTAEAVSVDRVQDLAMSDKGDVIASIVAGRLRIDDVKPAAARGRSAALGEGETAVAISADGKTLATGRGDGSVVLWGIATRAPLGPPLDGTRASAITALVVSADGTHLAAGYKDGTIRTWSLTAAGPSRLDDRYTLAGAVTGLAMGDDVLAATNDKDHRVQLWRTRANNAFAVFSVDEPSRQPEERAAVSAPPPPDPAPTTTASTDAASDSSEPPDPGLVSVALSTDGTLLAAGARNQVVAVWPLDVADGGLSIDASLGTDATSRSLAFSSTPLLLAVAAKTGPAVLAPGAPFSDQLKRSGSAASALAFSARGHLVAVGDTSAIEIWNSSTREPVGARLDVAARLSGLAFGRSDKLLASLSDDGSVDLWDLTRQPAISQAIDSRRDHSAMAMSPRGTMLATAQRDGTLWLWDVTSRQAKLVAKLGSRPEAARARALQFSPDGKVLASVGEDGHVSLTDVRTRRALEPPPIGGVTMVAFSRTGVLALVHPDAEQEAGDSVTLWNLADHKGSQKPLKMADSVRGIDFIPDGTVLVTGTEDAAIQLWDVAAQEQIAGDLQTDQAATVRTLAFSGDGKMLAAATTAAVELSDLFDPDEACKLADHYVDPESAKSQVPGKKLRVCRGLSKSPGGSTP